MDVKYRLGDEQTDAAILTDFPNVYHRICRLADHLMGYYLQRRQMYQKKNQNENHNKNTHKQTIKKTKRNLKKQQKT